MCKRMPLTARRGASCLLRWRQNSISIKATDVVKKLQQATKININHLKRIKHSNEKAHQKGERHGKNWRCLWETLSKMFIGQMKSIYDRKQALFLLLKGSQALKTFWTRWLNKRRGKGIKIVLQSGCLGNLQRQVVGYYSSKHTQYSHCNIWLKFWD